MTHELKILPKWFEDVKSGKKNFEIRRADRDFKVGDTLVLKEYEKGRYTGREIERTIQYIYKGDGSYGLSEEFWILGLKTMEKEIIDSLPTVNVVIPNNATNGDVIQALYPYIDKGFSNVIDLNLWWNAKCKVEIDTIDELEKIKAEIEYCRKKYNCDVLECSDIIDKEIKAARRNRWRKGE